MKPGAIPKPTLGRLPLYLHYLRNLPDNGDEHISATVIAKALELGEVQVRKDLGLVTGTGRPKTGHVRKDLIRKLEEYLSGENCVPAVLAGAGKLGRALLEYDGFREYGLEIIAAFDLDENRIGKTEAGKPIWHNDRLCDVCGEHRVKIGVITVPVHAAQDVCDKMVACGIRAIWNFAPCTLKVPDGVIVQQENLALSLAHIKKQAEMLD